MNGDKPYLTLLPISFLFLYSPPPLTYAPPHSLTSPFLLVVNQSDTRGDGLTVIIILFLCSNHICYHFLWLGESSYSFKSITNVSYGSVHSERVRKGLMMIVILFIRSNNICSCSFSFSQVHIRLQVQYERDVSRYYLHSRLIYLLSRYLDVSFSRKCIHWFNSYLNEYIDSLIILLI